MTDKKPEPKKDDAAATPATHEEMAAAAMAELIAEAQGQGGGEQKGPPEWFRKVFENT